LICIGMVIGTAGLAPRSAWAADEKPLPQPWEKFNVSLGTFLFNMDSTVRVGSGIGLTADIEKLLGVKPQSNVFRVDSSWRFTPNRRHRLDLSWFLIRRSATKNVGQDFDIEDNNGAITTIHAGTEVTTHFNLDIIEGAYSYSFFQDDRVDLAAIAGFYVMPMNFGLSATGLGEGEGSLSFTAPLPVIGYRMDFALTPRWFIRTGSQIFYVEYQSFVGKLTEMRGAVEYLPFKNFGFGGGIDSMRIFLEGQGKDYPNIDINGSLEFQYTGIQLYAKFFF
jgi:hypothetical protein